jgi:hypothetical protein
MFGFSVERKMNKYLINGLLETWTDKQRSMKDRKKEILFISISQNNMVITANTYSLAFDDNYGTLFCI